MESILANQFLPSNNALWRAQVQKELKNEDAYESLRWHTQEGFTLEPFYTADSLADLPLESIHLAQKQTAGWLNATAHRITDIQTDNATLRYALNQGANALVLTLSTTDLDVASLLNGIDLTATSIFFRFNTSVTTSAIQDFAKALQPIIPASGKGGFLDVTTDVANYLPNAPQFRTICASSHAFHNAGANVTQELAFTLALLADTYDTLTNSGLSIEQIVAKTMLSISVGTSYFMEIAKLRALRVLLRRFLNAYSPALPYSENPILIHCQTSTFYDAVATPYTNLLRSTTEAMAAVIGGCDALTVHAYDSVLDEQTDPIFAERIARNVSILLKEESFLDKVADPSAGSYYVENLTYQLVESAWSLFLEVEKLGGFAKAIDSRFIQTELERSYQKKREAIRNGKVLVGVTKFRSEETSSEKPTVLTENATLPNHRLAAEFE